MKRSLLPSGNWYCCLSKGCGFGRACPLWFIKGKAAPPAAAAVLWAYLPWTWASKASLYSRCFRCLSVSLLGRNDITCCQLLLAITNRQYFLLPEQPSLGKHVCNVVKDDTTALDTIYKLRLVNFGSMNDALRSRPYRRINILLHAQIPAELLTLKTASFIYCRHLIYL